MSNRFSFRNVFFLLPLFALLGCNAKGVASLLNLPSRYEGASSVRLDEYSIKDEIIKVTNIFNDSLKIEEVNQLWTYFRYQSIIEGYSSTAPNRDNLETFRRILNDRTLNVLQLSPTSFETIFALTRLPAVVYILSENIDGDFSANSKIEGLKALPREKDNKLALSMIKSISRINNGIKFNTSGSNSISGQAKDILDGNIVLLQNDKLLKVFSIFIVSRLPKSEIEEYINEWYRNLSYEFKKPEIQDFKQE